MHLPIDPAVACPFAIRYSLFATRYSLPFRLSPKPSSAVQWLHRLCVVRRAIS